MPSVKTQPQSATPTPERPEPTIDAKRQDSARKFAIAAAKLLDDSNCNDVLVFDVCKISQLTNFLIIATGTSDRQLKGVSEYVKDLAKEYDLENYASERDDQSKWLVEDFVDVIVHLFEPQTRAIYDLEMLWGDGEQVDWQGAK